VNLQHVRAVARKEWHHLLRDPRSLALMLLMPTMLLFLFGYAIRLDVTEAPIGVLQQSDTRAARELAAHFDASHAFQVVQRLADRAELTRAIQAGEIWAALVIPPDYARQLQRGRARLQLILDGVDANTARLMRNYALALVNERAMALSNRPPALTVKDRAWFNQARLSRLAILPGVIAIVMAVIGALMTSLTVAREVEQGNLVMLRTTPLTRGEFLAGKLAPYFVIGMGDLVIAASVAVLIFDVPLRGSVVGLTLVSALFLLVVMLQGAVISIAAGNQLLASQVSLVTTFLPAFLLSGFIFAIQNMPLVLQYATLVVPARYFVTLSKVIFLKGIGPLVLWTEVAALGLILIALAALAMRQARRLGLLP